MNLTYLVHDLHTHVRHRTQCYRRNHVGELDDSCVPHTALGRSLINQYKVLSPFELHLDQDHCNHVSIPKVVLL